MISPLATSSRLSGNSPFEQPDNNISMLKNYLLPTRMLSTFALVVIGLMKKVLVLTARNLVMEFVIVLHVIKMLLEWLRRTLNKALSGCY